MRPTRLWLAAAIAAVGVAAGLLVVLALAPEKGGDTGGVGNVPAGVPPPLKQPLSDLHDAVRGADQ